MSLGYRDKPRPTAHAQAGEQGISGNDDKNRNQYAGRCRIYRVDRPDSVSNRIER